LVWPRAARGGIVVFRLFLNALAQLATRAPRRVLAAAAVFGVVAAAFGLATPKLLGRGSNDFVAHGSESLRAERAIEASSGLSAAPQVLVLVRRPTAARQARVVAAIRSEPTFPGHRRRAIATLLGAMRCARFRRQL
jgi:hypothetical protein